MSLRCLRPLLLATPLLVAGCDSDGDSGGDSGGETETDTDVSTSGTSMTSASTTGESTSTTTGTSTGESEGSTGVDTGETGGGLYDLLGSIANDDGVSGQWVLSVNDADGNPVFSNDGSLASSADVQFNADGLPDGSTYAIALESAPADLCSGQNLEGTIAGADVTGIDITCADNAVRYSIDGTITGVQPGDGFVRLVDPVSQEDLVYESSFAGLGIYGFSGIAEGTDYELIFSNAAFNCTGNTTASGTLTMDVDDAVLTCTGG